VLRCCLKHASSKLFFMHSMVDETGARRVGRAATLFDTRRIEYAPRATTSRAVLLRDCYLARRTPTAAADPVGRGGHPGVPVVI
jgi:hypothetical protein